MLCYKYDNANKYINEDIIKIAANGDLLIPANSTLVSPPEGTGPWFWDAQNSIWVGLTLDQAKEQKLILVRAEKNRARDAGFFVDGVLFDSDEAARIAYLELAMKLQYDSNFSTSWKASEGVWVVMDATLFAQIYAAGAAHIAACFAWQASKEDEINACTSIEELNNIDITYPN